MQRSTANFLLAFSWIAIAKNATAQFTSAYDVGVSAGTCIYYGDLTPSKTGSWKTPGFAWGFTGLKHVTPTLSARLDLNFGKLRGDEARYASPEYRQHRAFAFNSQVTEFVVAAEWNPFGRERTLSPYLFGGIGYASMKISRDYSRFDAAYFVGEASLKELLAKDAQATLPGGIGVVPVGIGLKYALNRSFALTAEGAQRFTASDYIDGFSYSGNPNRKDSYAKYTLGLRYSPGNKSPYACPVIRY